MAPGLTWHRDVAKKCRLVEIPEMGQSTVDRLPPTDASVVREMEAMNERKELTMRWEDEMCGGEGRMGVVT